MQVWEPQCWVTECYRRPWMRALHFGFGAWKDYSGRCVGTRLMGERLGMWRSAEQEPCTGKQW